VSDVFVSYRSADARFGAAATYELLSNRFGRNRLFLDNQSIPAGVRYSAELDRALESMRVLLVLIGPAWLVADPDLPGRLLVERDHDWVRREIRRALERAIPIFPVLLDGTALPDAAVLPADIRPLIGHQAVEIHHQNLGTDVARLADRLAVLIPGTSPASGTQPVPSPRQLPARLARFVGRQGEITQLDRVLREATMGNAPIVVLSGTPGIGKTTLATHWAHRVTDEFPDGQLHVNLRGFDRAAAMDPGDALRGFLIALGVTPQAIPDALDARAAQYRSLLAARRVLVLLDNAGTAAQVRPLLPGAPHCLVMTTSRTILHGLTIREGAQHITLDLLTASDARLLFADRVDVSRLRAEPETANELVKWCAGLPLALCMVGALADLRRGPLSQVVHELVSERNCLDALELGDAELDLRTIFSWSYQRLSPAAQRLFRLLGIHPGPDISWNSCVALCPDVAARQVLNELICSNLIMEHRRGRLILHDLLRAYAREQADADPDGAERSVFAVRIVDHYLGVLVAAARWLDLSQIDVTVPGAAEHGQWAFNGYDDAMNWFVAETTIVLEAIEFAAWHGLDEHVWRMAWMCNTFLRRSGLRQQRVDVNRAAFDAAARADDKIAWAKSARRLASALARLGQYDEACSHLAGALAVLDTAGDRLDRVQAHLAYSRVFEMQQKYEDALRHARTAVELTRPSDAAVSRADVLINLGMQLTMLGRYAEALSSCEEALHLYEKVGHHEGQANCLMTIGIIHQDRGDQIAAILCYERSSSLDRQLGDRYWEAMCLDRLGQVYTVRGCRAAALRCWDDALRILEALHHPEAIRLRRRSIAHLGQ
jgi:tetratricopeptide (TPR) repeat protein